MPEAKSSLIWLWLSALVIGLDQASKWWVNAHLQAYVDVIAWLGCFNLVHVHNTGAAFSLLASQPGWQRSFFSGIALLAVVIILYLLRKARSPGFGAALALILGGALGNLIDRVRYGYVIDFLDFHLDSWHWPAFNVADSAITLGVILLLLMEISDARIRKIA